jgi:LEA14-like dessication related protein
MKKILVVALWVIGCGVFLAGCATFPAAEQANVTIVNVRPLGATVLETGVELTLRVLNETNQPLQLTGSSHKLALNGAAVGRAVSDEAVTVPALGTATLHVTVYLENLALLRKFGTGERLEQVSYRLESRLFTASRGSLKVTNDGALDLRPFLQGMNR